MEGLNNSNVPTELDIEDKPLVFIIFFLINLFISIFIFHCCLRKGSTQRIKYEIIQNEEMKEYDV